jgi:hypothetical protein
MKYLKKFKSISLVAVAVLFLMGNMVSSCGTKSTEQTEKSEDATEHPKGSEHPSDSSEHPSHESEHPAEHPSDSTSND